MITDKIEGHKTDAITTGELLAKKLIKKGAKKFCVLLSHKTSNLAHQPYLFRLSYRVTFIPTSHTMPSDTTTRTDLSAITNCINRQRRKVNLELDNIVKMKCTQSAYAAMSRQDRRITEYHWDRVVQEKSLQRDLKKADRMCDRIAQVLEQLRCGGARLMCPSKSTGHAQQPHQPSQPDRTPR